VRDRRRRIGDGRGKGGEEEEENGDGRGGGKEEENGDGGRGGIIICAF